MYFNRTGLIPESGPDLNDKRFLVSPVEYNAEKIRPLTKNTGFREKSRTYELLIPVEDRLGFLFFCQGKESETAPVRRSLYQAKGFLSKREKKNRYFGHTE